MSLFGNEIPEAAEPVTGEEREQYDQVVHEVEDFLGRELEQESEIYHVDQLPQNRAGQVVGPYEFIVYGNINPGRQISHETAHILNEQEHRKQTFLPSVTCFISGNDRLGLPKYHNEGFASWVNDKLYPQEVSRPTLGGDDPLGRHKCHAIGKAIFDSYESLNGEEETKEFGFSSITSQDTEMIRELLEEGPIEVSTAENELERYFRSYWSDYPTDKSLIFKYAWNRTREETESGEEIETVKGHLAGMTDLTYTSGHGWGR